MNLIFADTHTHLYLDEFDRDRGEMIQRSIDAGVKYLFLPDIDSRTRQAMIDLAGSFPRHCFPMAGLHPTSVKENYREEMALVEKELAVNPGRYCAIGEIGIDLYWSRQFESQQLEAFSHQLDLAVHHDLPVVIHTRNSFDITAEIIEKRHDRRIRGIFHCFGGSLAQAKKAMELGFLLGIGGIITYKNSGLQKVVEVVGLDHVVLETDSPFLPPVPHRGERNESTYIPIIAQKVAEIKNLDVAEVADVTTGNALKIYKLAHS